MKLAEAKGRDIYNVIRYFAALLSEPPPFPDRMLFKTIGLTAAQSVEDVRRPNRVHSVPTIPEISCLYSNRVTSPRCISHVIGFKNQVGFERERRRRARGEQIWHTRGRTTLILDLDFARELELGWPRVSPVDLLDGCKTIGGLFRRAGRLEHRSMQDRGGRRCGACSRREQI